jgi:large subunit ribosomal protein L7/L12
MASDKPTTSSRLQRLDSTLSALKSTTSALESTASALQLGNKNLSSSVSRMKLRLAKRRNRKHKIQEANGISIISEPIVAYPIASLRPNYTVAQRLPAPFVLGTEEEISDINVGGRGLLFLQSQGISTPVLLESSELVQLIGTPSSLSSAGAVGEFCMRPAAGVAEAAGEQTEFDVILESFDAAGKIKLLKVVREVTGLGLGEAKDLVEAVPKAVGEGINKKAAEELKKTLEAAGGTVTIK